MRTKSGQMSIEFTAVIASMLIILILIVVIFNGIYSQQGLHAQYVQANHAVATLSNNAKSAWASGKGAFHLQQVEIPPAVSLQKSSIQNNTINLHVMHFGDAFDVADFNVSGWWPQKTGSAVMALRNNGSHILIRPAALISVSPSGVHTSLASHSATIEVSNGANESFSVSQVLSCSFCTYSDSGTNTIVAGASRSGTLNIFSPAGAISSGYLKITASPSTPGSYLETVEFTIPITSVR